MSESTDTGKASKHRIMEMAGKVRQTAPTKIKVIDLKQKWLLGGTNDSPRM